MVGSGKSAATWRTRPTWRGRVDEVRTGARRYFTTLEDLMNVPEQRVGHGRSPARSLFRSRHRCDVSEPRAAQVTVPDPPARVVGRLCSTTDGHSRGAVSTRPAAALAVRFVPRSSSPSAPATRSAACTSPRPTSTSCWPRRPPAELAQRLLDEEVGPVPDAAAPTDGAVRARRVRAEALLVCLAPDVDLRYERLYAYLQDDVTRRRPTVDLVLRLLGARRESAPTLARARPARRLLRRGLLIRRRRRAGGQASLLARPLRVEERIVDTWSGPTARRAPGAVRPALRPTDDAVGLVAARLTARLAWCGCSPIRAPPPRPG